MDIQITTAGNTTTVDAPYSPDFPARAKQAGGRFSRENKTWSFDSRDEAKVREICREIYGTDGSPETSNVVTVRIAVADYRDELNAQRGSEAIWVAGRRIAERRGRDERVRLGPGVVVVEGGFDQSGGSVKNPALAAERGTVLEVRDVPAGHADLAQDRVQILDEGGEEEAAEEPDVEALHAERERLMARIAEIDEQLPQPEGTTASTREAAQILGVSVRTVQRWAASGRVDASKDEAGRWIITVTVAA